MNTPAKLKKSAKKCATFEKKIAGNAPKFDPVDPIFLLEIRKNILPFNMPKF